MRHVGLQRLRRGSGGGGSLQPSLVPRLNCPVEPKPQLRHMLALPLLQHRLAFRNLCS